MHLSETLLRPPDHGSHLTEEGFGVHLPKAQGCYQPLPCVALTRVYGVAAVRDIEGMARGGFCLVSTSFP